MPKSRKIDLDDDLDVEDLDLGKKKKTAMEEELHPRKKRKIELDDEEDQEKKEGVISSCTRQHVKPLVWALLVAFLVVVCFLIFNKNHPTTSQMGEGLSDLDQGIEMFPKAPRAVQTPQTGGQPTAWAYNGRCFICPTCGWRGNRLAIDAYGNKICPKCSYCPFQKNVMTGQGVAAVTSATPNPLLVRNLGMEVIDIERGVMVINVYRNSWAEKGGLQHGDIIATFNHEDIAHVPQFIKVVLAAPPEKRVPVKVFRLGDKVKLDVMVGEGEMEGVILPNEPQPAGAAVGMNNPGNGRMGGYGLGSGGYVVCPTCGFRMLHQQGVPAYSLTCPKCGAGMVREELLNQQNQTPQGNGANLQRGQGTYPWCPPR